MLAIRFAIAVSCGVLTAQSPLATGAYSGTLEVSVNERGTISAFGLAEEYSFVLSVKGPVKLNEGSSASGWIGTYDPVVEFNSSSKIVTPGSTCTITRKYSGPLSKAGVGVRFDMEVAGANYSLRPQSPLFVAQSEGGGFCSSLSAPNGTVWWPFRHNGAPFVTADPFQFALPAAGQNLTGQKTVKIPGFGFGSLIQQPPTFDYVVKWDLKPEILELVVDPEGYDTWRPEAGPNEDTIGNTIKVKVRLQNLDGSTPTAEATKFKFELLETSKEPGIAMNFPLANVAQSAPDLQIAFLNNDLQKLDITDFEGQNAETKGPPLREYTITLSSFDWGGWSRLKVTAELPGQPPIVGYLRGDRNMREVRFPKRAPESFIADVWKSAKGAVSSADKDDKEREPVGLPGCDGDGLTVYEEYRGFIENGRHIEGNLEKKDFFILNLIGADAEPGIWLFTDVSQLEVHKDMKQDELSPDDTQINRNCKQCPQRVAQHGVYMEEVEGLSGGSTAILPFNNQFTRGRPGLTRNIAIQPRMAAGSATSTTQVSSLDQPLVYDVVVAHELGHAVGLLHHGEGDDEDTFYLILPENPNNTLGKPYITDAPGNPVSLLDEVTGADAVDRMYTAYQNGQEYIRFRSRVGEPLNPSEVAELEASLLEVGFQVGMPSQQHSGAVECIMRYFFSSLYPKQGQTSAPQIYYLVPPGSEPLGVQFCDTGIGTGINKEPRTPQSRYFNAAQGKGACRHYVCVNDAIPPGQD